MTWEVNVEIDDPIPMQSLLRYNQSAFTSSSQRL